MKLKVRQVAQLNWVCPRLECNGVICSGKKHYNEFHAVKMARQLMVEDEGGNSEEEDQQDDSDMGEKFKHSKSGSNSPMDTETKE